MVARLNRRTPLSQVLDQRVDDPLVQRALDSLTRPLKESVDYLQPFVQFEPWKLVGMLGQPAFGTSWQNYTGALNTYHLAGYRKGPLGRVELRGLVERTGGAVTTIFVLPLGYRPAKNEIFAVYTNTGVGRVDVQSDGQVILQAGGVGFSSLSGITFDTEP